MFIKHVTLLCLCLLLGAIRANAAEQPGDGAFKTQIAPLLQKHCNRCHGAKMKKAGLRLDQPAFIAKGSESGDILSARRPDESLLIEMIESGEMPPGDDKKLTKSEIDLFRAWIKDGARLPGVSDKPQVSQHDVIPILLLRCTACHGASKKEGGLDLRTKTSILKGGKSGPAAISGNSKDSLLIQRVHNEEMPPRRLLVEASVKPMEEHELGKVARWIDAGFPEIAKDAASPDSIEQVSDEERRFWSFQPPRAAPIPNLKNAGLVRTPIDAFILRKQEARGLSYSPEAGRGTLLRRLYFDLIGLPPTPDEVAAFENDTALGAYERLLERLLASPHYGERWGRHWLDVAGYADSEGAQNEDRVRPHMYRYRDYVIRSLNTDKPYSRFIQEQLAGDEMVDYRNAKVIDEETYDHLVATGFLRTAPDRTFANITNFVPDRLEVIADEVQILSSALLGLTMNCARCHSHKFDPIPQSDYYRLTAILKDAFDEHDWLKSQGPRTLNFVSTFERQKWEARIADLDRQVAPLQKQVEAEKDEAKKKKLQEQIKALNSQRPAEPRIRALWSRGRPSPSYVLRRGNYLTTGRLVEPGVPQVLSHEDVPFQIDAPANPEATGRRLAFARWITHSRHPLTSRVFVNRVWHHYFGSGIVTTLDNFGVTGAKPSHPELLDWLAVEFVRQGGSLKQLHRLIVTSSVYRQSSRVSAKSERLDPDGRLLSRMPLKRMQAEILRDSLLVVAGRLDTTPFGSADGVTERGDGLITVAKKPSGWRRSVYVLQRRTKLPTILENFDIPQMSPNCTSRGESIVAPQALHLLNNTLVRELAGEFADRVVTKVGDQHDAIIVQAFVIALSRKPSAEEMRLGRETLSSLETFWKQTNADKAKQLAVTSYCHSLINSAAFLYID